MRCGLLSLNSCWYAAAKSSWVTRPSPRWSNRLKSRRTSMSAVEVRSIRVGCPSAVALMAAKPRGLVLRTVRMAERNESLFLSQTASEM